MVDFMKFAHAYVAHKGSMMTFGDLLANIVRSVFHTATARKCSVVCIVGDVYNNGKTSIN